MNRRDFFMGALGLAAAPLLPALPVPAAAVSTLFRGELGRWNGVSIVEMAKPIQREANKVAAAVLDRDCVAVFSRNVAEDLIGGRSLWA